MRRWTVFFLLLFTISSSTTAMAVSSTNVPLDNWAYAAIEKLDGFGLIHSDIQGTRPFTRMEVARLVNEALKEKEGLSRPLPPLAVYLLERFQREYKDDLLAYTQDGGDPPRTFLKPLNEVEARYVYVEGEPRAIVNVGKGLGQYPGSRYGILASEGTPLVYNNEGIVYGEHNNFSFRFSSSARLFNIFTGYVEPLLLVRENEGHLLNFGNVDLSQLKGHVGEFDQVDVGIQKGYVKVAPWNVELEVGRDSMWWGNGRHGELILSNNAPPLDMIKLSNPTPSLLPWFFSYLGPFKYTAFAALLEDDRVIPHPTLMGLRLNFKPVPTLEIGLNTTFLANGAGQPTVSFEDLFFPFAFGDNNKIDQLSAVDVRLQLPFLRNAEVYGEYAGEDSGGTDYPEEYFGLGDVGWLVGLYMPRLTDDGKSDLRIEYANNSHRIDPTPAFWYGNAQYRSGYTYEGLILGHHMAGDAVDFFVRTTRYLQNNLVVGLDYDWMTRGLSLNNTEERMHQVGADVTYELTNNLSITARYGFEAVDNFDLLPGISHQNHLAITSVKLTF